MSKKNRNRQQQNLTEVLENENLDQETIETEQIEETSDEQPSANESIESSIQEEPVEVVTASVEEVKNDDQPIKTEAVEVEEKKEVKPNPPIYKEGVINVEKTTSQVAAAQAAVSPAVAQFNELAEKYITNMTSGPINDTVKRCGIAILANIARHVTMTTDVGVFEACFKFFVKNRSIMLNSTTVTDGISKYLDKNKIAKVIQFYVTFQTLAESKILGSKFTLNVTTIRRIFNNDALANWLLAKRG